jgi:chromosome segregation ATPase
MKRIWLPLLGVCGTERRKGKEGAEKKASSSAKKDKDEGKGASSISALHGGRYVEVNAKKSVLIDTKSLEMSQEALRSLQKILQRERQGLSHAKEFRLHAIEDRAKAQDLLNAKLVEKEDVLKEVLQLREEIEGVKQRLDNLNLKVDEERDRQAQLETQSKHLEQQKVDLEAAESRKAELDQEVLRAQAVLRTERNTRIKLQAQLQASTQQSTAHLNQEKDTLHAELSDLDGSLRREREKQSQLKRKLQHFHAVLEKADSDVSATLQSRREKMERLHDQLMKSPDSPLKAEYRRASQRLQREKEEVEVLKLQYNILANDQESQEVKVKDMEETRQGWISEEKKLRDMIRSLTPLEPKSKDCQTSSTPPSTAEVTEESSDPRKEIARELFPQDDKTLSKDND